MDTQIIEFYYKWDRFEKQNGVDIIDFNLLQEQDNFPGTFNSREEVKEKLISLIEIYQTPNKNPFLSAKLTASLYFLRALMNEQIPFDEYIQNTVGVSPLYIPEEEVQKQLEVIKSFYKELGYEYTREDLDRFTTDNKLSKDAIEKAFLAAKDNFVPKILEWLGLDLQLNYVTKFVDVNDYWMNWTSTDDKGNLLLQFNLNKRNTWKRGFPEDLALHEICCHAIQASSWKKQVEANKLSPAIGLTTVFTPEIFLFEGIGDTLSWFYPENLFSTYGKLAANAIHLYWITWNNAHIMINKGKPMEEILTYLDTYMPGYETEQTRKENVIKAKNNPIHRQYLYVYGISSYYHLKLAEKLTNEEKKNYVLSIYKSPITPKELIQKYNL